MVVIISEVAKFTDGDHAAFAEISIYRAFESSKVKKEALAILHNALIGKTNSIDSFGVLFHFPGNVPKFVNDYALNVDSQELFDSFYSFLKISLLIPKKMQQC